MSRLSSIMFLTCLMAFTAAYAFAQETPLVNSIEVSGLRRIEEGAVKSRISQKAGESVSAEKTAEDIRNIYKMGYFDDVRVDIEYFEGGVKLIYAVKEKATVVKVEFQGNKELKDEKLREKLAITVGSIADTTLIQDNADKLRLFYEEEGYWLANIIPVVSKTKENEVVLTYLITEGEKVRIKKINIEGNKAVTEGKISRAMKTGEWWIFSFITSSGYYKKETMNADIEAIKNLYFDNGYIKVVVAEPEIRLTDDKKGMNITIQIAEGDQYRVSSVDITDNKAFASAELRKKTELSPGLVFSREILKKDITAITELYTRNGYALATVFPNLVPDDAARQVRVTYKVEEGDIYRMGRIEVTGNIKTRDKTIRREMRLDEGEVFNSELLKRSYERINNLNFFESVDLIPKTRPEEKFFDIDIKVKERPTGFLSVGGGYSSIDRFIGMADITQGNLFGRGQYIKLKTEIGGRSTLYELSFREPWFMDKPVSFTADIYKTSREYVDYKKDATGFGFGFGKNFTEYWSGNILYNFERATILDISSTASDMIKEQEGTRITSSVTPSVVRDSRDSFLDPSRGSRNSAFLTFAGIGGTNAFIKSVVDSAWFFPVRSSTISLRGRFGFAAGIFGKDLPLYERFYVGGINTVRGLGFGQAGPVDDNNTPIGGTKELIFNAEFIFPVSKEMKLKGVTFVDVGSAFNNEDPISALRYTTGFGFRWISPMGPLRIEWGYNLRPKLGEEASRVEFTFGSFF